MGSDAAQGSVTMTTQLAMSRVTECARHVLSQRREWTELADRSAYAKPENFAEATGRLRKNINYFKVNYVLFMMAVMVLCLLTHPASMFMLVGLGAAWVYMFVVKTEPLVISGRTFSDREKLIGMSALSLIIIFFLSSIGTVIFMGLGLGCAGVAAHGAMRVPDDLFLDENAGDNGFFAFLKPPQTGTATI